MISAAGAIIGTVSWSRIGLSVSWHTPPISSHPPIPPPQRDFHGAILVYDLTNRESFLQLNQWKQKILELFPRICFLLIGNKVCCSFIHCLQSHWSFVEWLDHTENGLQRRRRKLCEGIFDTILYWDLCSWWHWDSGTCRAIHLRWSRIFHLPSHFEKNCIVAMWSPWIILKS